MFEMWMSIVGASMAFAGVPQIIRLLKRKKSEDLSLLLWWIVFHGNVWWLIYGFWKHSWSLIITNILCIITSAMIICLIVKYRKGIIMSEDLQQHIDLLKAKITDHAKAIEALKELLDCPELNSGALKAPETELAIDKADDVIEKYEASWETLWQLLKSKSKKSE